MLNLVSKLILLVNGVVVFITILVLKYYFGVEKCNNGYVFLSMLLFVLIPGFIMVLSSGKGEKTSV